MQIAILSWYEAARTPDLPDAAPVYFGFGLDDFNRDKICRAVIERHVLNIYAGFKKMPVDLKGIRLTGGLSKSEAWRQMIADIFGAQTVPVAGEGAALGAAIHAGWAWVKENQKTLPIADFIRPYIKLKEGQRCSPDQENQETYKKLKQLFLSLSKKIRGLEAKDVFSIKNQINDS